MGHIESPEHYEARLKFLEREGRRCHGNKGKCTQAAVHEAEVYPVNSEGKRIGENITLKMCGKRSHCGPYLHSSAYVVVTYQDISRPQGQHADQKRGPVASMTHPFSDR